MSVAIGIDIGGTNSKVGVADGQGKVLGALTGLRRLSQERQTCSSVVAPAGRFRCSPRGD